MDTGRLGDGLGAEDAGAIFIKHNRFAEGCTVLTPTTAMDGGRAWSRGTGEAPVPEAALAARPDLVEVTITPGAAARPSELDAANPDDRLLGVAVRRIDISPAG